MRLERGQVDSLARSQAGVLTAAQLLAAGADDAWLSRMVRSGQWQRLHRGVLLTHSGTPSWRSRAWAAVLHAGAGAALSHEAAAHLHEFRASPPRLIEVSIPARRRVATSAGLRIIRRRAMPPSSGRPRRTWPGDTVVDLVASATTPDDAIGWVSDAVRAGTSTLEMVDALARRPALPRSRLLHELVADADAGIESPLERRYHHDVERRHGLPRSTLQHRQRVGGSWIRADVRYEGLGVRVELDGAFAHPGGRTDADTWRDNAVLVELAEVTLRYRWRHVAGDPCRTAAQVHRALTRYGRPEPLRRCGPVCGP